MAKRLYTPVKLGNIELSNRIVMGPMGLGYANDGYVSDRLLEFFRQRAKGQPGLIIVGGTQVDKKRYTNTAGLHCFDEKYIPGLKKFTDMIHAESEGKTKVFFQFLHHGRYSKQKDIGGVEAVAPSAVPSPYTKFEMPHALTIDEIREIVGFYGNAARIAKEAGADGIEICTNSGYLIGQFFSPITNKREDEYGGSLENRMRFYFEVVDAIREAVGNDFVVTTRIGGSDLIPGSNTIEDAVKIARAISDCGRIDALSVTGGWHESSVPQVTMEMPWEAFSFLGRTIKDNVDIPVMMSNRLGIEAAERYVEEGALDLAVFARAFLADPEFAKKAAQGRYDEIRYCIGCNQKCLDRLLTGRGIVGCLANVSCGLECDYVNQNKELPDQVISEHKENILVIGAGPAGMEFARVASARGHKVTVCEKNERSGGQMLYAAMPPRRKDIDLLRTYLENVCKNQGVCFITGRKISADETEFLNSFDRIVVATGSKPVIPDIPVEEGADVVMSLDVLSGKKTTGRKVVVAGAGAVGTQVALSLAEEGTPSAEAVRSFLMFGMDTPDNIAAMLNKGTKTVSLVGKKIGKGIGPGTKFSMIARIKQLGVNQYKGFHVIEIKQNGACLEDGEGNREFVDADTVVIALGTTPDNELYEKLKGLGMKAELNVIGDAQKSGYISDAMEAAYELAVTL